MENFKETIDSHKKSLCSMLPYFVLSVLYFYISTLHKHFSSLFDQIKLLSFCAKCSSLVMIMSPVQQNIFQQLWLNTWNQWLDLYLYWERQWCVLCNSGKAAVSFKPLCKTCFMNLDNFWQIKNCKFAY